MVAADSRACLPFCEESFLVTVRMLVEKMKMQVLWKLLSCHAKHDSFSHGHFNFLIFLGIRQKKSDVEETESHFKSSSLLPLS